MPESEPRENNNTDMRAPLFCFALVLLVYWAQFFALAQAAKQTALPVRCGADSAVVYAFPPRAELQMAFRRNAHELSTWMVQFDLNEYLAFALQDRVGDRRSVHAIVLLVMRQVDEAKGGAISVSLLIEPYGYYLYEDPLSDTAAAVTEYVVRHAREYRVPCDDDPKEQLEPSSGDMFNAALVPQ